MATARRFEELACWEKARVLTREIYQTFRTCRDSGFRDQIQRAAVSVMSNIAEGFERGTTAEFLNYLYIAKGSCGEVRSQLYAAFDAGYTSDERFKSLKGLSEECSVLIWRMIESLKASQFRGSQFKQVRRESPGEAWLRAEKERLGIVWPWEKE